MSRLLRIAVREYLAYVRTVGFWLSMAMVPIAMSLSIGAPILMARSTPPPAVAVIDRYTQPCLGADCPAPDTTVGAVVLRRLAERQSRLTQAPPGLAEAATPAAERQAIAPYFAGERLDLPTLDVATGRAGPPLDRALDYAVILTRSDDPNAPVRVRIWSRNVGGNQVRMQVQDAVSDWTQAEALRRFGVSDDQRRAIMSAEPAVESYSTRAAEGRVSFRDRLPGIVGFAMAFALWSAAMTGAGILLNSVIEEKSSRILEVLLSSASVLEIMAGKILGVAMVTLTVLGVWASLVASFFLSREAGVGADVAAVLTQNGLIFYFLFYFIAGYLMYATLFITVGAFCETSREAQTLLGPMMLVLIVPLMFLVQTITQPDNPVVRVLSWVPLFTPFMMAARAAAEPPWWEVAATGTLLIATIAAELWLAGRAFKAGALSTTRFDLRLFFSALAGRGNA